MKRNIRKFYIVMSLGMFLLITLPAMVMAIGWDTDGNNIDDTTDKLGSTNTEDLVIITDNTERMRITSDGSVGIGVAPTEFFEVDGGTADATANGLDIMLTAQDGGAGDTDGGDIILIPGIRSGTGDEGRVGIMTTDPDHSLEIDSPVGTQLRLTCAGSDNNRADFFVDGTGKLTIYSEGDSTTADIELHTESFDNAIFIDESTQGVGIGTATPGAYKLYVNGGDTYMSHDLAVAGGKITGSNSEYVEIGETNDEIKLALSTGDYAKLTTTKFDLSGVVLPGDDIEDDTLDFTEFQDTLDLDTDTDINLGIWELIIDLDDTGDFEIHTDGAVEHIFADNGDVGIGTNNPNGYKLYVAGNTYIRDELNVASDLNVVNGLIISGNDESIKLGETNNEIELGLSTGDYAILTTESFDLSGVTLPGDDIQDDTVDSTEIEDGTITSTDIDDGTITSIDIQDSTITGTDILNDNLDFVDFEDTLNLDTTTKIVTGSNNLNIDVTGTGAFQILNGGTAKHIFTNGGKVGIGTVSPSNLLSIYGGTPIVDIETSDAAIINGDDLGTIQFRGLDATEEHLVGAKIRAEAAGTWDGLDPDNAPTELQFFTEDNTDTDHLSSPRMVIDCDGNVGIGSTSPAEKLDVDGKLHMRDNIKLNGNWLSNDGGNEGIYVDEDGFVGIGESSPGGALEITSTTGGFIVPRMTNTQQGTMNNIENGMIVYDTTNDRFEFYQNGGWVYYDANIIE